MSNKIGIYLGAYKAEHPNYNIVYQDINGLRDIPGDMLSIDLSNYDFVIATPPCNYWSHARGNRCSNYALETMHLLPGILEKLKFYNKPYIVENVRNERRFNEYGLLNRRDCFIYRIGRHTYWSNIMFNTWIEQSYDFKSINGSCVDLYKKSDRQGGINVHKVIESWLKEVHNYY